MKLTPEQLCSVGKSKDWGKGSDQIKGGLYFVFVFYITLFLLNV